MPHSSRPLRARGLKLPEPFLTLGAGVVAPPAGAWIETVRSRSEKGPRSSRAPCGRVD